MRRLLIWLLTIFPLCAFAQPAQMPYDAALMPCYLQLTSAQQRLFDDLYEALSNGVTNVALSEKTAYSDAETVLAMIRRECAELCLPRNGFAIQYYRNEPDYATAITWPGVSADERHEMETAISQLAILPTEMTDSAEMALLLHDRLCSILHYDSELSDEAYTPQCALRTGNAKCATYASQYALLCRMNGIPCCVQEGIAWTGVRWEEHAWNEIILNDNSYLVDVTWDDRETDIRYDYFSVPLSLVTDRRKAE